MITEQTLEEAAERILANNIDGLRDALQDDDLFFFYKDVIQCYGESMAEWQADRMYSEEEVEKIAKDAYEMGRKNILIGVFNKWFKQFKNK